MESAREFAIRYLDSRMADSNPEDHTTKWIKARDALIRKEAAERAVKWQCKLCRSDDHSCDGCPECDDLCAAVMGKKEGETK
jgi:hypothetical protein